MSIIQDVFSANEYLGRPIDSGFVSGRLDSSLRAKILSASESWGFRLQAEVPAHSSRSRRSKLQPGAILACGESSRYASSGEVWADG